MKQKKQQNTPKFRFVPVNGIGTIATNKGYIDVFVHGYIEMWGSWYFIVHQDIVCPELINVSEASTGFSLKQTERYYSVEDALYYALPFIDSKRYHFSTTTGDVLVKTRTNLLRRNTTNLQTLAIDSALWLPSI